MGNATLNIVATMMKTNFSQVHKQLDHHKSNQRNTDFSSMMKADQSFNKEQADRSDRVKVRIKLKENGKDAGSLSGRVKSGDKLNPRENQKPADKTVSDSKPDQELIATDHVDKPAEAASEQEVTTEKPEQESLQILEQQFSEIISKIAELLNLPVDQVSAALDKMEVSADQVLDLKTMIRLIATIGNQENPTEILLDQNGTDLIGEVKQLLERLQAETNPSSEAAAVQTEQQPFERIQQAIKQPIPAEDKATTDIAKAEQAPETKALAVEKPVESLRDLTANNKEQSGEQLFEGNKGSDRGGDFSNSLNQVIAFKTETIVIDGNVQVIEKEVTAKEVFHQIVTNIKSQVSEGKLSLVMQLNPQNLGKISVNISSQNGVLSGHFVAESEQVKKVIESNLIHLKEVLVQQGVEVTEIKVTVGNSAGFLLDKQEKETGAQADKKRKQNKAAVDRLATEFAVNDLGIETEEVIMAETSSVEFSA